MKVTRCQLRRLIIESIDDSEINLSDNEITEFRTVIMDLVQSGELDQYNQAADLNKSLGLFNEIELGKQFWKLKIKSKRSFKIRSAKGYLINELFEHFDDVKDNVFHNYAGVDQTGPALYGTRNQMFAMLTMYLSHDLAMEGFIEKEQSAKEYPGLLALFREDFNAMIEMFLSPSSPYPYVIVEVTPSGGDKNLDMLKIYEAKRWNPEQPVRSR